MNRAKLVISSHGNPIKRPSAFEWRRGEKDKKGRKKKGKTEFTARKFYETEKLLLTITHKFHATVQQLFYFLQLFLFCKFLSLSRQKMNVFFLTPFTVRPEFVAIATFNLRRISLYRLLFPSHFLSRCLSIPTYTEELKKSLKPFSKLIIRQRRRIVIARAGLYTNWMKQKMNWISRIGAKKIPLTFFRPIVVRFGIKIAQRGIKWWKLERENEQVKIIFSFDSLL